MKFVVFILWPSVTKIFKNQMPPRETRIWERQLLCDILKLAGPRGDNSSRSLSVLLTATALLRYYQLGYQEIFIRHYAHSLPCALQVNLVSSQGHSCKAKSVTQKTNSSSY